MAGSLVSQALNVAISPILARLYQPAQIGILGLLASIYSVVTPLACWRYEQAIMLASSDDERDSLLRLALVTTCAMALLTLIGVVVFARFAAPAFGTPSWTPWLWATPALLVLAGVYQTARVWLGRAQSFGAMAVGRMSRATVGSGAQIGAAWVLPTTALGLVGGYFAGLTCEAVLLARAAWRTAAARRLGELFSLSDLKAVARRHRKFPIFAVPGNLSNMLAVEGPTILLATLFMPAEAGLFWFSYRLLAAPVALIGEAVSTVYYQRMAAVRTAGVAGGSLTTQVFVALLVLAIVPMAVLFAFAPAIFRVVFGPEWVRAGDYARALVPAELMLFAALPLTQAFFVYEKQERQLIWNVVYLALAASCFVAGRLWAGPLAAVQWYSLVSALMYGSVVVMAFRWSGGITHEIPAYLREGFRRSFGLVLGS